MNHTTSLEVSKQLKEAGFSIDNRQFNLWWYKFNDDILVGDRTSIETSNAEFDGIQPEIWLCEAYLLTELMERMPRPLISYVNGWIFIKNGKKINIEKINIFKNPNVCDEFGLLFILLRKENMI